MPLTTTQIAQLKAAINAETDPTFVAFRQAGSTGQMAEWLSSPHPTTKAWGQSVAWPAIGNAIEGSLYTPSAANLLTFLDTAGVARLLAVLVKLTWQQNMILMSGGAFNAADTGNLDGLLDSVKQVPSGNAGANTNPGGTNGGSVAMALTRSALRVEPVFGATDVTRGGVTAKQIARVGGVTDADVVQAINS